VSAAREELEGRLQHTLDERYHHRHPFNLRMHAGELSREEIRTWVRNRYYYQTRIPIKDGLILSKAQEPAFRRDWIRRIQDHDGNAEHDGGLSLWLDLAQAVGLERRSVEALEDILPGVRAACDAYVEFVASHDLLESVAASLTELRAGALMRERAAAWETHYRWVEPAGLAYFRARTTQAPADAEEGLRFVLENARTAEDQDRCLAALERKCQILWNLLDAVDAANARPRLARRAQLRNDPDDPMLVLPERAVRLNGSGGEILALCDGKRSAREIADALRKRHPDVQNIENDVHHFLAEMRRLGALEHNDRRT